MKDIGSFSLLLIFCLSSNYSGSVINPRIVNNKNSRMVFIIHIIDKYTGPKHLFKECALQSAKFDKRKTYLTDKSTPYKLVTACNRMPPIFKIRNV